MTIQITKLTEEFSTAPQINVETIAEIAAAGFKTIINNRPDNEGGAEQPKSDTLKIEVERLGLNYISIPVIPNNIQPEQVAAFVKAFANTPKPVLAFCRTGNRANKLFSMAQASQQ